MKYDRIGAQVFKCSFGNYFTERNNTFVDSKIVWNSPWVAIVRANDIQHFQNVGIQKLYWTDTDKGCIYTFS